MNTRDILDAACTHHGVDVRRVLSGKRTRLCSTVRWQTIVLAREFTCASYPDIAEALELSSGTALIHAMQQHKRCIADAGSAYARSFNAIKNQLEQGTQS